MGHTVLSKKAKLSCSPADGATDHRGQWGQPPFTGGWPASLPGSLLHKLFFALNLWLGVTGEHAGGGRDPSSQGGKDRHRDVLHVQKLGRADLA